MSDDYPKLNPAQQKILAMVEALPEGVKLQFAIGGRIPRGAFGEKDGKITHRWDGTQWVTHPTANTPGKEGA